jgi:hypothetical protein
MRANFRQNPAVRQADSMDLTRTHHRTAAGNRRGPRPHSGYVPAAPPATAYSLLLSIGLNPVVVPMPSCRQTVQGQLPFRRLLGLGPIDADCAQLDSFARVASFAGAPPSPPPALARESSGPLKASLDSPLAQPTIRARKSSAKSASAAHPAIYGARAIAGGHHHAEPSGSPYPKPG